MKKILAALMVVAILGLAGLTIAAYHTFGLGSQATATTTTARVAYTAAVYEVSIFNGGTTDLVLHVAFNCTTNQFNTLYTGGNTIPIRGGNWFTTPKERDVQSFCYRAASGSFTIDYGAF